MLQNTSKLSFNAPRGILSNTNTPRNNQSERKSSPKEGSEKCVRWQTKIKTRHCDKSSLYEPMTHRVDRIYYEACELNQNLNSDLSFITKKQKQIQKKDQQSSHNKENIESGQFQVEKLINNVDNFRYVIFSL